MSKFKVGDEVCVIRKDGTNVETIAKVMLVMNNDVDHGTSYRLEAAGYAFRGESYYDHELFRKDEVEAELERRYKKALDEFREMTSKYKVGDKLIYMPRPSWSLLNDFSVHVVKVLAIQNVENGVRHYLVTSDKSSFIASESDLYTKETTQRYVRELVVKAEKSVDIEATKWLVKIDKEFDE